MIVIEIVLYIFAAIELSNVLAMYFQPESKYANAVGVFNAWKKSKEDPQMYDFTNYLVKWVAGSKLIFVFLLPAIAIFGNDLLQVVTLGLLIPTILTFYGKMFPLIRKMDKDEQIIPKNYSRTLAIMILSFILVFTGVFTYGLTVIL